MSYWIWYPGDFEFWHAMKQNFSRVERGMGWPAFWKSDGIHNRVFFRKEYDLEKETSFTVFAKGAGYVLVNDSKYPFGTRIVCAPGKVRVTVHLGRLDGLPSALVEGDVISSGEGWMADDYETCAPADYDPRYNSAGQDPAVWDYDVEDYRPIRTERAGDGWLYEFQTELTASLEIRPFREGMKVYCGESKSEALAGDDCYLWWTPQDGFCPRCALRYVYIPGEKVDIVAHHQYVAFPQRASFNCDDPLLNKIWKVAEHTFRLCSGIFFLDGIKRDQWIWSGDAYQSVLVNRYLLADPGVERRTLTALRGKDKMTAHINTIVDYTLLWALSLKEHMVTYDKTCDEYLKYIEPKLISLIEFCLDCLDSHGFLIGKEKDWTFIDWADLDKDGPNGAEQMLLYAALRATVQIIERVDNYSEKRSIEEAAKVAKDRRRRILNPWEYNFCDEPISKAEQLMRRYTDIADVLLVKIRHYYWNEEKGAFIDSFTSGRDVVTRQTNILAIRCEVADERQTGIILKNVLENDEVPSVRTPYFQFYYLDVMGRLGRQDTVFRHMKEYFGGMLERGAVTFWEDYNPEEKDPEQYAMYGDPYGKSLCHAWAASPIYLISKYFVGLDLCGASDEEKADRIGDQVGDETGLAGFTLTPCLQYFKSLDCTLPIGEKGSVKISWDGKHISVNASGISGLLNLDGKIYELRPGAAFEKTYQ